MARKMHWIDGHSGRRYSHEWPFGSYGSPPFGSSLGTRAGVVSEAPFYGQGGAGQTTGAHGVLGYGSTSWPIADPYTWFQMGYWFKLNSPPSSTERYQCYRGPWFVPVNHHPNVLTYATRGWGIDYLTPHVNEIYYAYGSTYTTNYQFSGVTWPGFQAGRWYWVEFRVGIAKTASGVFELRIDETQIVRMTGIQTFSGTATVANSFTTDIHDLSGYGLDQVTDDMYVITGSNEGELEWFGKSAVETLIPSNNGSTNDFDFFGGISNYQSVRTTPYSDDSGIRKTGDDAAMTNALELYEFTNVDTTRARTIRGVKVTYRGKREGTNKVRLRPACYIDSTLYLATTSDDYLGPEYGEYFFVWMKNPATAADWTASEVNSAQFGFRVTVPA